MMYYEGKQMHSTGGKALVINNYMINNTKKAEWFVHRTWTTGEARLTIIWARNKDDCINDYEKRVQIINLDKSVVDDLPDGTNYYC